MFHSQEIAADLELIEQVLINLLNNALDAINSQEEPEISISGIMSEQGRVILQVTDPVG